MRADKAFGTDVAGCAHEEALRVEREEPDPRLLWVETRVREAECLRGASRQVKETLANPTARYAVVAAMGLGICLLNQGDPQLAIDDLQGTQ